MGGDFSRNTFDASKHFSRVLMQQGRVQLDADFNEQGAILLSRLRLLARDLLGRHAAPLTCPTRLRSPPSTSAAEVMCRETSVSPPGAITLRGFCVRTMRRRNTLGSLVSI